MPIKPITNNFLLNHINSGIAHDFMYFSNRNKRK